MTEETSASARAQTIAKALRERGIGHCEVALVLGTGLGEVVDSIEDRTVVPYEDVHGMPRATAPGHAGQFVFGRWGGRTVLALQGRFHPYEGWSGRDIASPIYALRNLGVQALILTNASGALNTAYRPGDVVLIEDHINLTGVNPLVGPNDDNIGVRFPDLSQVYWPPFRALARDAALRLGLTLPAGVYAGVLGPSLETPAERRFLRMAGADLVGMSTVCEVLAAGHCGIKVLAFAAVTNMALGAHTPSQDSIEDVLAQAKLASVPLARLLHAVVPEIAAPAVATGS